MRCSVAVICQACYRCWTWEMLRPAAQRILDQLTVAHFVNPRLSIDNYFWGFFLAGHVMATTWRGEVELKLSMSIQIPSDEASDYVTADCQYIAESNEGSKPKEEMLWRATATFPPGGSIEQEEMRRLMDGMTANLRPSVQRVLDMATGSA